MGTQPSMFIQVFIGQSQHCAIRCVAQLRGGEAQSRLGLRKLMSAMPSGTLVSDFCCASHACMELWNHRKADKIITGRVNTATPGAHCLLLCPTQDIILVAMSPMYKEDHRHAGACSRYMTGWPVLAAEVTLLACSFQINAL